MKRCLLPLPDQYKGYKMAAYDLIVIGGGPAGVTAALRARELGVERVALVEARFTWRDVYQRRLCPDTHPRTRRPPDPRGRTVFSLRTERAPPRTRPPSATRAHTAGDLSVAREKADRRAFTRFAD
jgi:cation diffusion facilitator CzcD-associated flavoprotein CzcO